MEILGEIFKGPIKLNYSKLPQEKGIYIIASSEDDDFNPIYIGYSVNLKRRIKQHLTYGPISKSILKRESLELYYAVFPDYALNDISKFEDQLIREYLPIFNQSHFKQREIKDISKSNIKIKKYSSIVAGIASSVALAITILILSGEIFNFRKSDSKPDLTETVELLEREQRKTLLLLGEIKKDLLATKSELDSITLPPTDLKWTFEAKRINEKLSSLESKMVNLENAISIDPIKAVSIPLIRKDLDNLIKTSENEISKTREDISQVYDLGKWAIGLIATIALGVLGMAINSFENRKN